MQFLTLQQTEAQPFQTEYRYSTAAGWACLLVSIALTTVGGFFLYRACVARTMAGLLLSGWFTFWFGLFAMFAHGTLRARLRKTNWLVRTQTNGMLVKFRSYLNHHFDESDPVVVHVPYSEIEFVRVHRVRQTQPGLGLGEDTIRFMRFAEFRMRDDSVVKELDARLAEERNRQAPQQGRLVRVRKKASQSPVQVSNDGFVRIEWHVWPRLRKFIEELTGQVPIQLDAKSGLSRAPKENTSGTGECFDGVDCSRRPSWCDTPHTTNLRLRSAPCRAVSAMSFLRNPARTMEARFL